MIGGLSTPMGLGIILSWRDQATRGMKQAEGSLRGLQRQAKQTTEQVAKQAEQLGLQYQRHARNAKTGLVMMGVGAAITAPFILMTKGAIEFQDQLGKLRGLLGAKGIFGDEADRQAQDFGRMINNVANNSRQDFNAIVESSYPIVSGLKDMAAVGPVMQRAADLATAANGNMVASTEAVIVTMNTFGERWGDTMTETEKADRIFTTLTNVVGMYYTNINDLTAAMKYATPIANLMGQSFEGTASAVGLLQMKGLGQQLAGTAYAASMRGLIQLTTKFKDKTLQAKSASMNMSDFLESFETAQKTGGIEKIQNPLAGLKFRDESGRMMEIWEIVANMEQVFGITAEKAKELGEQIKSGAMTGGEAFASLGMSVADVTALQEVMGDEGMRGWALWLGQSEALRANAEAAGDLAMAEEALANAQDTVAGKLAMLKNRATTLSNTIGGSLTPVVERITSKLLELMDYVNIFLTMHPNVTKWVAWGGAALGALVLVGGAIMTVYSGLMMIKTAAAIQALATASGAAIPSMMGLGIATKIAAAATWVFSAALWANPITWIIAGVIALGVGIYLLVKYWDDVTDAMMGAWKWMVKMFNKAPNWLLALVFPLGLIIRYWDQVSTGIGVAWGWMKTLWNSMPGWLQDIIFPLGVIIRNWELLKEVVADFWEMLDKYLLSPHIQQLMRIFTLGADAGGWLIDNLGLGGMADWLTTTGEDLDRTMVGHYDIPDGSGMQLAGAGGGVVDQSDNRNQSTIYVYGAPGQSEEALANKVVKKAKKLQENENRRDTNAKTGGHLGWS